MMKPRLATLAKDTLIYGSGNILIRATAFATMPVFTRLFTPEDYGVWSVITTTVGFIGLFILLGGDNAYARFFFAAKTTQERQTLTSTWFAFLAIWSICVVLLGLAVSGWISSLVTGASQHRFLIILALLAAPVTMINSMCGQVLRNQFRPVLFSMLALLTGLLVVACSLFGVAVMRLGVAGAIGGVLVATLTMLPVRLWTARAMLRPRFNSRLIPTLLRYGVPFVPAAIAYGLFTTSDRILLSRLSTLEQAGLYSVAVSLVSIMVLVNRGIGQAWTPYAVQMYEDNRNQASIFFGQMTPYLLLGLGLMAVLLSTLASTILRVLATSPFYAASTAVAPLALATVALGSTQITALGITLSKRTYWLTIHAWVAAGINVGLNVLLIPRWGMIAAAWTTLASYLFLTLTYAVTSQKLFPITYNRKRIVYIAAITVPLCVIPGLR